jgi:hypothetical protein
MKERYTRISEITLAEILINNQSYCFSSNLFYFLFIYLYIKDDV